jgi:hypothetical protein
LNEVSRKDLQTTRSLAVAFAKVVVLLTVFVSKAALAVPEGHASLDVTLGVVSGSALDKAVPDDGAIDVHFYLDRTAQAPDFLGFVGQTKANLPTSDTGPHGFSFGLPRQCFDGGPHHVYVYAVSANGNPMIANLGFTLTAGPIGKLESIDPISGRVRGWVRNPSSKDNASLSLDVFVDTSPAISRVGAVFQQPQLANLPRAELNVLYRDDPGDHGFSFVLPAKYFDGAPHHTLYVQPVGPGNPIFPDKGLAFTLPAQPIIGGISSVATEASSGNLKINGWACQVGVSSSIPVSVYAGASAYFSDGSPLTGTLVPSTYTTSTSSAANNATCGAGSKHNFQITVTKALRQQFQGLPLFVHGLRVTGTPMNAMLDGSGTLFFPLDSNLTGKLMPGVTSAFVTPAMLQRLLADSSLTNSAVWASLVERANAVRDGAPVGPYYGSRCLPLSSDEPPSQSFMRAFEWDLSELPYVALACQVKGGLYCDKGVALLAAWATPSTKASDIDPACWVKMPSVLRAGVQLYCPKGADPDADEAFQAGLTLARGIGQIVESYQLLATHMTSTQRDAVARWVRELGYTIKKSSLAWNTTLGEEGPNNHLQWHNYGMVLAGLVTGGTVARDNDLVTFALTDPANSQTCGKSSCARNYYGMVTDAVREVRNTKNIFRARYDLPDLSPCFGLDDPCVELSTGEIWDRYRHVTGNHGLPYSLFALNAMTYTAHLASINGLTSINELTNSPTALVSFVDPNDPGVPPSPNDPGVPPNGLPAQPTLFNAFDFYSHLMVDTVRTGSPEDETAILHYPAYQYELACDAASDIGAFLVGRSYVPVNVASRIDENQNLQPTKLQDKNLQDQMKDAQNVCRDLRLTKDFFQADKFVSDGIPQLYLLAVYHEL